MDGVPNLTQLPIAPNTTFVYDFHVDGTGEFWYHSHMLDQYIDGVSGAFVVRDDAQVKIYSDRILFLKDYYRQQAHSYLTYYLSPESGGSEPTPDNVLMNGIGQTEACRVAANCSYVTALASEFTQTCGEFSSYDDLLAAQRQASDGSGTSDNKITRLILIAGNAITTLNVQVDGHYLWLLSLDGLNVVPTRMTSININAGQRVSVGLCRVNSSETTPA